MTMDRRRFMGRAAQGTAAAACAATGWYALLVQQAHAAAPLRPPGAGAGDDFLARCIKCGQCVQACPYDSIRLVKTTEPGLPGTPTIVPRQTPCYMCEPLYCVKACPSGALDPALSDITQARMGLAVVDPEHCLSWLGLRCEVCFRACPAQGQAITLHVQQRHISKHAMFVPVVNSAHCTGCGVCEKKCPTEVAAIRVLDPASVQGRVGAHYRLGWMPGAPQAGAGADAAPPPVEAPPQPAAPAAAGGLDYLNRGNPP